MIQDSQPIIHTLDTTKSSLWKNESFLLVKWCKNEQVAIIEPIVLMNVWLWDAAYIEGAYIPIDDRHRIRFIVKPILLILCIKMILSNVYGTKMNEQCMNL